MFTAVLVQMLVESFQALIEIETMLHRMNATR
jgi:hypothetical protein